MELLDFSKFKLLESGFEIENFESYINALVSMTHGKQKEFYEWQKSVAQEVKIDEVESVFPKCTKEWVKKHVKVKSCFENAARVLELDPEVKYIQGIVMIMDGKLPIDHAWNSYKGKYFDVTKTHWKMTADNYYKLVELDYKELWEILQKIGSYDDVISYMIRNGLLKI